MLPQLVFLRCAWNEIAPHCFLQFLRSCDAAVSLSRRMESWMESTGYPECRPTYRNSGTAVCACSSLSLGVVSICPKASLCSHPGVSSRATGVQIWTRMCICRTSTVSARCVKLISESCPTLCSRTSCTTSLLWVAQMWKHVTHFPPSCGHVVCWTDHRIT